MKRRITLSIQYLRSKKILVPVLVLVLMVLTAICAPILSNHKPLYVKYKGHHLFPALSGKSIIILHDPLTGQLSELNYENTEWKFFKVEKVIWPPFCYSAGKSDLINANFVSPFHQQSFLNLDGKKEKMPLRFYHWLGTGKRGEDTLAGIIYGTRISLFVGIISVIIGGIIGMLIGAFSGYLGNNTLKLSRTAFLFSPVIILLSFFFAFISRKLHLSEALEQGIISFSTQIFISILIFVFFILFFLKLLNRKGSKKQRYLPVDSLLSKLVEIFISIPKIILIITFAAFAKPSITIVILVIALTIWPSVARQTRSEFLKIKTLDYISSARVLGYNHTRIIFYHILPNILPVILSVLSMAIASAILAEASLSFLGIGIPPEIVTWGGMISSVREQFNAWWLILFPSAGIFLTVYALNSIGLRLSRDKKLM